REDIEELARSGLPALTSTGWDSYLVDAASRAFTWMRAAGAGPRARLVIGPWGHAAMFSSTSMVGEEPPGALLEPYRRAEPQRVVLSPDAPPRIEEPDLPTGARRPYGRLVMDRSGYEAGALTWTTGVLAHPCEITGYPVLEVRAAVSHPDAAFVVELTDVAPA